MTIDLSLLKPQEFTIVLEPVTSFLGRENEKVGSFVFSVVEAVCGGNFRAWPENYPHIYCPPQ
jgi:hypothetical protein